MDQMIFLSFMSTVDLFADSPQGGWGETQLIAHIGVWLKHYQLDVTTHREGGGEGNPGGVGREPWNISLSLYIYMIVELIQPWSLHLSLIFIV